MCEQIFARPQNHCANMQTMRDNETFCINSLQNLQRKGPFARQNALQTKRDKLREREGQRETQFGHVDTNDYPVATLQKKGILRIRIDKWQETDYKKRCIVLGRNEKRKSLANSYCSILLR